MRKILRISDWKFVLENHKDNIQVKDVVQYLVENGHAKLPKDKTYMTCSVSELLFKDNMKCVDGYYDWNDKKIVLELEGKMEIVVVDKDEKEKFRGDIEDYLEENNYDEDLASFLESILECRDINQLEHKYDEDTTIMLTSDLDFWYSRKKQFSCV